MSPRWDLALPELDGVRARGKSPALVAHIVADVRSGRLRPGQRLPSTRALAAQLGVHKNTVLRAVEELVALGYLETEVARGVFVARALPAGPPPRRPAALPSFLLPPGPRLRGRPPPPRPGALAISAGAPDARLFPVEALARAWRRVAARHGRTTLGYGPPEGHPALRAALSRMVADLRRVPADPEHVLVTRGSQMALDLAARALLRPGDRVAVEALGYAPAWDALALSGAELVPVPVDDAGIDLGALERLARERPLRAVYVTPHHQFPTMVTLSAERRLRLTRLAAEHQLVVLEDDYDHEFHYEGRPVFPLRSQDDGVVMIGTLSKILAPGLRVGFVVAHPAVIERMVLLRRAMDRQGDLTMEAAIAELIDEGELARHVRRVRGIYRARRDLLVDALAERFGSALEVPVPRGGIGLFARAPGVDADRWAARAAAAGVAVAPGSAFAFDGRPIAALRLVFAGLDERELRAAVDVLARTRP